MHHTLLTPWRALVPEANVAHVRLALRHALVRFPGFLEIKHMHEDETRSVTHVAGLQNSTALHCTTLRARFVCPHLPAAKDTKEAAPVWRRDTQRCRSAGEQIQLQGLKCCTASSAGLSAIATPLAAQLRHLKLVQ